MAQAFRGVRRRFGFGRGKPEAARPSWLSNIRISRKLSLAFVVVVAAVLAMSAILWSSLLGLVAAEARNAATHGVVEAVNQTQLDMLDQMVTIRTFLLTQDPALVDRQQQSQAKFDRDLGTARAAAAGQAQLLPMLDALQSAHDSWQSELAAPQMKFAAEPATQPKALLSLKSSLSRLREKDVRGKAEVVFRAVRGWSETEQAAADNAVRMMEITLAAGGALAAGLSAAMGVWLSRSIARPVLAMTGAMQQLAAGHDDVAIPAVGRTDELGRMAGAVQSFKDAALAKQALEADTLAGRRTAEADRSAREVSSAEAARQQAVVVEAVAKGLERLSAGDLLFRLEDRFAPEYETLRRDFNGAMDALQGTLSEIVGTMSGLHAGSGEISSSADDLSKRTEQQAASLEETAAALDEITATVRKTAEGASHARRVVGTAKTDAEHSGDVVRQAVTAMGSIEKSSGRIGQIIGVIDEIAFQTNLLALNAGVEAARAGDAGRGFAVVASEVRALAQRSATAAKEIKTLVSASSAEVEHGVSLVDETGKALVRIVAQVNEINAIVAEIAASAQEQATGLDQVNSAVNQMDQVTQQNAAMVEETTAASHRLTSETEDLSRLIGRFRVGTKTGGPGPRQTTSRAAVAMKTTGRGGAAPAVQDEDWREF